MNAATCTSLAQRLRAGDRQAFAEAYQHHKADVLALAAAMLGRTRFDLAGDVLHDVFISLASAAPGLDPACDLKAYLLTAAANRSRDHLRRRRQAYETIYQDEVELINEADLPPDLFNGEKLLEGAKVETY